MFKKHLQRIRRITERRTPWLPAKKAVKTAMYFLFNLNFYSEENLDSPMEEENSGFRLTKPESIPHFSPNECRQAPFVGARSEW